MKLHAFAWIFLLLAPWLRGQSWGVDDLVEMRKWGASEEEICKEIEGVRLETPLNRENFLKLRNAGFSNEFLEKLRESQGEAASEGGTEPASSEGSEASASGRTHRIAVEIRPKGAGEVVFSPPPDAQGNFEEGTLVTMTPRPRTAYLFDHWEGHVNGYAPVAVKMDRGLSVTACFSRPERPEAPPAIKDPVRFQDSRRQGYLYRGDVTGLVSGQGSNKDWGFEQEMNYEYMYRIKYTSDILSNDGFRIREKRSFHSVRENILVSRISLRLNLRDELKNVKDLTRELSLLLAPIPEARTVLAGAAAGIYVIDRILEKTEKYVALDSEKLDGVFRQGLLKFARHFIDPEIGKVLGYPPQMRILEGKTCLLEYQDGVGLVKISLEDGGKLTACEQELLQRAFYLSDYYIFRDKDDPERKLRVGDSWRVDARTLAGVMDPRLRHKTKGVVELARGRDIEEGRTATFSVRKGSMRMDATDERKEFLGEASFTEGSILYDMELQYVKEAELEGRIELRRVSRDHFLFQARLSSTPTVSVHYECSCTKK